MNRQFYFIALGALLTEAFLLKFWLPHILGAQNSVPLGSAVGQLTPPLKMPQTSFFGYTQLDLSLLSSALDSAGVMWIYGVSLLVLDPIFILGACAFVLRVTSNRLAYVLIVGFAVLDFIENAYLYKAVVLLKNTQTSAYQGTFADAPLFASMVTQAKWGLILACVLVILGTQLRKKR